jgi:hypothetical protein
MYYLLIILPVFILILIKRNNKNLNFLLWLTFFLIFLFIIGFRNEVGADWGNYVRHYEDSSSINFFEAVVYKDVGYSLLNWLVYSFGGGVYVVNTICAAISLACLIYFARRNPYPWLYVSISIYFYIVVIGMSLTRQSVAIGFFMIAIHSIINNNLLKFTLFIILASLFHKTALLLMPLYFLITLRGMSAFKIGFFTYIGIFLLIYVTGIFDGYYYYIKQDWQSEGAIARGVYFAFPAFFYFLFHKNFGNINSSEKKLLNIISFISILSMASSFLSMTILDRFSLYLTPFPAMIYCKLITLVNGTLLKFVCALFVITLHIIIMYIWINYSNNSIAWMPYRNFIIENLF